jgi:hypothetical protein
MPTPAAETLEQTVTTLSRRRLFRIATLGAVAVAACEPRRVRPAPGLDATERAIFTKLVAVMLPTAELGLTPAGSLPIEANIARVVEGLAPAVRKDFGAGLMLFEYGAFVIGWNFARFTRLGPEAATDYCARWQSGGDIQRGLFGALKQIVCMSYWREPATWPAIGYEGPVTARFGLPRLGNAPLPQE